MQVAKIVFHPMALFVFNNKGRSKNSVFERVGALRHGSSIHFFRHCIQMCSVLL